MRHCIARVATSPRTWITSQMSHITCHRCGGTDHYSGYGHGGPVFGMYTICDCGCLLECLPDTEGLSAAEAQRCEEVARRELAFAKLPGPARQRAMRRHRRLTAWRRRS